MSKRNNGVAAEISKESQEVVSEPPKDKQERLLNDPNPGHFSLVRAYHLADLITLMNGFCGVMSILSSLRYCIGNPADTGNAWAALALMPLGLFFDFFDGKVARWRKKSSLMGAELDSLADLVSYNNNEHGEERKD